MSYLEKPVKKKKEKEKKNTGADVIYCVIPKYNHIDLYITIVSVRFSSDSATNVRWFDEPDMYVTQQKSRGRYFRLQSERRA